MPLVNVWRDYATWECNNKGKAHENVLPLLRSMIALHPQGARASTMIGSKPTLNAVPGV